ncbi:MAG TPA: ATP-binding protein [Rhizomicrobium sp.]|nr:ATP-binding protein [Rhizomicrobium sp.]
MRARIFQTETFRLSAIYAGLFLGSMLLLIALVYFLVSHAFEASLLRDARDDLAAIRKAYFLAKKGKELHEAKEMIDDRLLASDSMDLFLLQRNGKAIAGNLPAMRPILGTQRFGYVPPPGAGADASGTLLGQGAAVAPGVYAFVGRDLFSLGRAENEVLAAFGLTLAAMLGVAVGGGLVVSRSFVRRVDTITATCRSIMAGRLNERIPVRSARNELDQLGATVNQMLDRINALMEGVTQVSNDIAHDLRTPLTHLRYKLERARLSARDVGQYQSAVDAAIADCDELIAMFGALLRIAQIESGSRRAGMQAIDAADVLRDLVTLYGPALDDSGHPFGADIGPGLHLNGDPQLLLRLFSNLIDNAIHHTPVGTAIALSACRVGGAIRVAIADAGPGIPPEDREKVFRRFYRREQSRTTPGSGLGLALASAIADLHGARIFLEDNRPGLRAVVEIPAIGREALARAAE